MKTPALLSVAALVLASCGQQVVPSTTPVTSELSASELVWPAAGVTTLVAHDWTDQPLLTPQGDCSLGGTLCGKVSNRGDSNRSLPVTFQWGNPPSNIKNVAIGKDSTSYGKDADGFGIPSGCRGYNIRLGVTLQTFSSGWYKVYDGQRINIKITC